jgi:hypothetical protein
VVVVVGAAAVTGAANAAALPKAMVIVARPIATVPRPILVMSLFILLSPLFVRIIFIRFTRNSGPRVVG